MSRATSSVTQAVMILSGQSVISRVYTSRFGNGSLGTSAEVVLKKVPGTVPSGKRPKSEPYRTVPYHAVEKRQKGWSKTVRICGTVAPQELSLRTLV